MLRHILFCLSAFLLATPSLAQFLAGSAALASSGSGASSYDIHLVRGSPDPRRANTVCGLWVDTHSPEPRGGPGTVGQLFWPNSKSGHYEVVANVTKPGDHYGQVIGTIPPSK